MNFSFLNQYFLFALPLLAIPVIIHLLNVKKAKILKFSEVKFIKLAVTRAIKRIRLWQYLLLVLRILAMLFLIFIFARPVLQHSNLFLKNQDEPLAVCLILDNSYSMGAAFKDKASFETGKDVCENLLKVLRNYDKACFLTLSDKVELKVPNLTNNVELLKEKIKSSRLSFRTTSVRLGLTYGYSILKESNSKNKQIIFVTDFAKHGFNVIYEKEINNFDKNVKIIFIDVGKEVSNMAISNVEISSASFVNQLKFNVCVENYSAERFKKVPISLFINEQKYAYGFFDIEGFKKVSKNLFCHSLEKTDKRGYVKLNKHDSIAADNIYYFKLDEGKSIKILCVDGDPKLSQFLSETFYLKLAFNPDNKPDIVPSICVPNEIEGKALNDFNVIFLCNVADFSDVMVSKLKGFVKNGGHLIYFLGDKVSSGSYDKLKEELFPADILQIIEKKEEVNIGGISKAHPLFRQLDTKGFEKLEFETFFDIVPRLDSAVLVSFKNNKPFLIEKSFKYTKFGKILVFPFPADRDWSNFPLKPVYLPFVREIVKYLTTELDKEAQKSLYVGDSYKKSFAIQNLPKGPKVIKPDGLTSNVPLNLNNEVEFKDTEVPGFYRLKYISNDGLIMTESFTVNLNVESNESDLNKEELANLKKMLPSSRIFLISEHKNIVDELILLLRGREISKLLIGLIIILLIMESYLSLRRA